MPDLTEDLIAARVPGRRQPRSSPPGLDEDALRATMRATLAERPPGEPLRLFSYGALMWEDGGVPGATARPSVLPGFARAYCLRDIHNRGTPEAPALTLGLLPRPDARCEGVLFTLDPGNEGAALWSAWQQEMTPGFYRPAWVRVLARGAGTAVPAITFVTRETHPLRVDPLPEEVARILSVASGPGGAAADYLRRAVEALQQEGMRDEALERIAAAVAARLSDRAAPARGEALGQLP